jgi:glutaconate CoA-transferase subunit B
VSRKDIADRTGWPIRFAAAVAETPPPGARELAVLRDLQARSVPAGAAR